MRLCQTIKTTFLLACAVTAQADSIDPYLHLYAPIDSILFQTEMEHYLSTHPQNVDLALVLAKMYLKKGKSAQVRNLLLPYLWQYQSYTDLYLMVINAYILEKKYQAAKTFADLAALFSIYSPELEKKRQDLIFLLQAKVKKPQPQTIKPQARHFNPLRVPEKHKPMPEKLKYLNEAGVYQQNYFISDVHQIWDYTSAFYARETSLGKLYGRVNYANRLHREAPQFEVEFFPKLNKYVYLDLGGALANQPFLFPHYMYQGEAFFVLPHIANLSAGGQFNRIDSIHQYTRFTGSVTKEIGDHSLMFRPYFYLPGRGPASALYTANYRYVFKEPMNYFGVVLGIGSTPDLADLLTVNFLKLQNKIFSPYVNFGLLDNRLTVNINLLYQNQVFPSRRVRDWRGATLGLAWKY